MKVFISWSGQRSKAVAELFNDWLKCVIQASQPWISTRDIDRGAIWFSEINDKLKDVSVGIV
ncbi:TPA: toll-Interleukin receptor, partial [Klebsiella pneumoniae]